MKKKKYDVIVVGAGPSGSMCAKDLALKGYDVLLAEKRPVVGVPVRCGEATSARQRLAQFTEIKEDYIETDIHGLILHTPHNRIQYDGSDIGLMLDRTVFDPHLAREAERAGAELCLNARVSNVLPAKSGGRSVRMIYQDQEDEYSARVIVGADGVESLCGQWAGLKTRQLPQKVCSAIEFLMEGEDPHPNHLSFWVDLPGIKRGYVWVFPKVKSGLLNIGAGTVTPKAKEPNMEEVTRKFVEKFFPGNKLVKVHGGAVPVSGFLDQTSSDNFVLVGDAAHHTNPLTGGGIASGMFAARIAAGWIDKGLQSGDLSGAFFKNYERDVWQRIGKTHRLQMRIRDFMFETPPEGQKVFFGIVESLVKGKFSTISKAMAVLSSLGLAWKYRPLVKKILRTTPTPKI